MGRHGRFVRGFPRWLAVLRELGQAEVKNLRRPALHEKNVGRLDVAVHDAFGVRSFQPVGELNSDVKKLRDLDGLLRDAPLQRLSLEQLHGDKRTPFKFLDIVNRADVGMIQRGSRACFTPESLDGLRILGNIFGKEFQRNIAAEPRVLGFVDDAHAAAAKFFEHGVMGDGAPDNRRSIRHLPRSLLQPLHTGNRLRPLAHHIAVFRVTPNCVR